MTSEQVVGSGGSFKEKTDEAIVGSRLYQRESLCLLLELGSSSREKTSYY